MRPIAALAALPLLLLGQTAAMAQSRPAEASLPEIAVNDPISRVAADHAALLASPDPRLAANKRLVYDMYRIVLQAGLADRAGEFIAADYIQHNPNAGQGLAGVQEYVRATRPERAIEERLELPLIHLMAEGDYVMTAFLRTERDAAGNPYHTTWFDLYRIENGLIAEHWDPMLKTDAPIDPNTQRLDR